MPSKTSFTGKFVIHLRVFFWVSKNAVAESVPTHGISFKRIFALSYNLQKKDFFIKTLSNSNKFFPGRY